MDFILAVLTRISSRLRSYARYRQTVTELEAMPLDVALDLNIYRGDARHLARRAVYGARSSAPRMTNSMVSQ